MNRAIIVEVTFLCYLLLESVVPARINRLTLPATTSVSACLGENVTVVFSVNNPNRTDTVEVFGNTILMAKVVWTDSNVFVVPGDYAIGENRFVCGSVNRGTFFIQITSKTTDRGLRIYASLNQQEQTPVIQLSVFDPNVLIARNYKSLLLPTESTMLTWSFSSLNQLVSWSCAVSGQKFYDSLIGGIIVPFVSVSLSFATGGLSATVTSLGSNMDLPFTCSAITQLGSNIIFQNSTAVLQLRDPAVITTNTGIRTPVGRSIAVVWTQNNTKFLRSIQCYFGTTSLFNITYPGTDLYNTSMSFIDRPLSDRIYCQVFAQYMSVQLLQINQSDNNLQFSCRIEFPSGLIPVERRSITTLSVYTPSFVLSPPLADGAQITVTGETASTLTYMVDTWSDFLRVTCTYNGVSFLYANMSTCIGLVSASSSTSSVLRSCTNNNLDSFSFVINPGPVGSVMKIYCTALRKDNSELIRSVFVSVEEKKLNLLIIVIPSVVGGIILIVVIFVTVFLCIRSKRNKQRRDLISSQQRVKPQTQSMQTRAVEKGKPKKFPSAQQNMAATPNDFMQYGVVTESDMNSDPPSYTKSYELSPVVEV